MSRKGELWRADIAQKIGDYLDHGLTAGELTDWAIDHPFYDDQSELDEEEKRLIALGLAVALQLDESEPAETRTTETQLRHTASALWSGSQTDEN